MCNYKINSNGNWNDIEPTPPAIYSKFFDSTYIKANKKISPDERIAEIQAWKYVVNLIKNKRRTDDLLYARSMLYYAYTDGYNNNGYYLESPTLEFLIRTDLVDEYCYIKRRMERENYTFDTRLTTGLPVTQEEYDKGILQKVRLQKRKR